MIFRGKILGRGQDSFRVIWNNGEIINYVFRIDGKADLIEARVEKVVKGFERKRLVLLAHQLEQELFGYVNVWIKGKDNQWRVAKTGDILKHGQSPAHYPSCNPDKHYEFAKDNIRWEAGDGSKNTPTLEQYKKHCKISKIMGLD